MVKLERINLEKKGLTKFFSPNEGRILELLWKNRKMTSPDIQFVCNDLSLACVSGTLDRLVKSGFVNRKLDETEKRIRYIYSPSGDRKNVGNKISTKILESLVDTFGESTLDSIGKISKKGR
ncbi:MAG: BlaI/MecI/CopY family transcriptional regulator [Candidatus Thermoplasmatota archaeon]